MSNVFEVQVESLNVVVSVNSPAIQINENKPEFSVNLVGPQGQQGIQGVAGAVNLSCIAGETIFGHRAVMIKNGLVYLCDSFVVENVGLAVGISTQVAMVGESVNIQIFSNLSELSWNWFEGPIFVGQQGRLVQVPEGVFVQKIATAIDATEININPQLAILRS